MKTIITLLLMSLMLSFSVAALTLKEAKQQGIVGEKTNGYLGLVHTHTQADKLIIIVNKKRLSFYTKLAKKNKISLSGVAKLAGKKAIAKTKKGNFIQSTTGQWVKK